MIRINNTQYFHFLQHADVLRRSGSLCDAIISVKSQTFRAHRLVLACASRALAQQLNGGSDSPARCTLEYFSPHTFQQVLDFTYTQALDVSVDDLRLLLRAAELLEMQQLEDQCRRQLDTLDRRASAQETKDVKEEKESAGERNQTPAQEDELREERQSVSAVTKKLSHPLKNHNDPVSIVKRSRLSPTSALCRDTVITRPVSATSSFSSPWTFTANMRESVSTLRRITENFISAHPLQYPHQSSAANPFSLAPPHMIPLLSSRFQSPVQSFVMGCSSFHPRYTQNLYVESTKRSSILKQGPLKRKQPGHRAFTGTAQNDKPSVPGSSQRDCQHCDTRALDDAVRPESASSQSGKRCAGCQLCGSGDAPQPEAEPRRNHRGEKPYQCQHCPKKFSLKHQLDTHHRVHTGEKPFECRLCGQRSRDYSAMIKHLRTHGGAAPYQCTLCLEFCSSLVLMQRHVKSHAVQDFPPNWNISSTYLYVSHI